MMNLFSNDKLIYMIMTFISCLPCMEKHLPNFQPLNQINNYFER